MVATFGETTGHLALQKMHRKMAAHPEGSQVLLERPRISSETIDIEALGRLPENTFGYAYYRFLSDNVSLLIGNFNDRIILMINHICTKCISSSSSRASVLTRERRCASWTTPSWRM